MAVSSTTTVNHRQAAQSQFVLMLALTLLMPGCNKPPATSAVKPIQATDQPSVATEFAALQLPSTASQSTVEEHPPVVASDKVVSAATRVRLADDRPAINAARLAQTGIQIYRGQHLVVLSDLPAQQVSGLPELADSLFDALEKHFGKLPAAVDDSSFQVTGHLIGDEQKFRQSGLMPSAAFTFAHGKHVNYEFWMFDPPDDYYRRHLMLHEFTHCFMTCESGMRNIPPLWYIEGMAEYFATHSRKDEASDGGWQFGILPDQFAGFEGWGRISEFRRSILEIADSGNGGVNNLSIAPLPKIMPNTVSNFDSGFQYSSSWALCWFLHNHPQHSKAMRPLTALKHRDEFIDAAAAIRQSLEPKLSIDWLLFAEALQEGFDTDRAFAVHAETPVSLSDISTETPAEFSLLADRGWQDSGLRLQRGQTVRVQCTGRFTVNRQPQDWVSEPNGVSIEYVVGRPLGQIVAVLVNTDGTAITNRISVGKVAEITSPFDCNLWLQVNDSSNSLGNNSGQVKVSLAPVE